MKILVRRNHFTTISSIGDISIVDDDYRAFSVEDVARAAGVKIPKETAIPPGCYPVRMTWSPRHGSMQPQIMNVPMFSGVRFDVANYASEVEGCIGVGNGRGVNAVWDSKSAQAAICAKIQAALDRGELVWVEITNEP
jgi:hypothetical protein